MPTYPHQQLGFAVVAGGPLLAACFVALRIYVRKWMRVSLDWSDYLVIVASVFSLALVWPSIRNMQMWHYGIHVWDVDQRKLEPNFDEYYKVQMLIYQLNAPIIPLVKASIVLLLLKVGWVNMPVRKALLVLLVFIPAFCISTMISFLFMCPVRTGGTWMPTTPTGTRCIGVRRIGLLNVIIVTVNLFTDILILPIPLILMRGLQRTGIRARLTIFLLFAISLSAGIIGAVRLKLQWRNLLFHDAPSDWTYTISFSLGQAENCTTIAVACIPPLRALILRWSSRGVVEDAPPVGQTAFAKKKVPGQSLLYQSATESAQDSIPTSVESDEKQLAYLSSERTDSQDTMNELGLRPLPPAWLSVSRGSSAVSSMKITSLRSPS